MTCYSVYLRDQINVKGYEFLSFAKNMDKNFGKNIIQNLSSKCGQKFLDHPKQSGTYTFKAASKRGNQKSAEVIGHLVGNKIADEITKVSRTSSQNSLEAVESEPENTLFDKQIPKKRYVSPESRQKITDNLTLE